MATAQRELPVRTNTSATDPDDAIPDEDTSEVTKLFLERLQAWKHACGYLEDYISATEKMQHAHGKEYEKVLKVGRLLATRRGTVLIEATRPYLTH